MQSHDWYLSLHNTLFLERAACHWLKYCSFEILHQGETEISQFVAWKGYLDEVASDKRTLTKRDYALYSAAREEMEKALQHERGRRGGRA